MHRQPPLYASLICGLSFTLLLLPVMIGCGTAPIPTAEAPSRERPDSAETPPAEPLVVEDDQDNGLFEAAQYATLPVSGEIEIQGTISFHDDIDIYALGPAVVGDRIIVDVTGHDGINLTAALFNETEDLIDANDDRSYYGGLVDPYISQVMQADWTNVYLAVAVSRATHFASRSGQYDTGSYSIRVQRAPDAPVRQPRQQVVYLDFEGGASVQIGLEPIEVMRPFSAESISDRLAGQTDYIVGLIVNQMRRDYANYDVVLLDSKHDARPAEPYSSLFFGNYNANYLGLADNVDTGNAAMQQEAIIYSEDLALWESLRPSAEEVAVALANIASHELGHLLGLEHTSEAGEIMATAASARQVLEIDAEFRRALLQAAVFPTGYEDNPATLLANVGPNPYASRDRMRLEDLVPQSVGGWRDDMQLPDIPIVPCTCCGHHACDGHSGQ